MGMKMLSVALAAIALGAVTVAPAGAAPEGNTIVEIRSAADGLCLDFGRTDTPRVGMGACTGGSTQQFERVPAAAGGSYLRAVGDGRCVDGSGPLTRSTCQQGVATQRFAEVADAGGTVRLSTTTPSGTRFADSVLFASYGEVVVLEDSARLSQRWLVRETGVVPPPQPGAAVKLRSAQKGTCVAEDDRYLNLLKPCADAPRFERADAGGGQVALRSEASGECLTAWTTGAVSLEACDGSAAQRWTLTADEVGNHTVANGDQYLTPNNNHVIVFDFWNQNLVQHWQLVAA